MNYKRPNDSSSRISGSHKHSIHRHKFSITKSLCVYIDLIRYPRTKLRWENFGRHYMDCMNDIAFYQSDILRHFLVPLIFQLTKLTYTSCRILPSEMEERFYRRLPLMTCSTQRLYQKAYMVRVVRSKL